MGSILSRFKRKKNTKQVLESLENEIMTIEKMTSKSSPINYYKIIFHSALLYGLITILYYFGIFSYKILENNYLMAVLAAYPILALYYYKFDVWNYNRKKEHYKKKLAELRSEKKKILDDVMENETFKVAKEILEKYAPHQLHAMHSQTIMNNHRSLPNTPNSPQIVPNRSRQRVPNLIQIPAIMSSSVKPRLSLPRPVLPKERSLFDRLADIILGDGPQNRYALICRTCGSHNGMARKEEFEYLAYRCAYCSQWNPSIKPRPAISQFAISYDNKDLLNKNQLDNSRNIEEITGEENSKDEPKDSKIEDSNLESSGPIVEEPEDSQPINDLIDDQDQEKNENFNPIENSTPLLEAS